jgi:hypothetical protein
LIEDALNALHVAKPNHWFPHVMEAFQSAGLEYVNEVIGITAQYVAKQVDGLTLPATCQVQTFASGLIQYKSHFD